MNASYPRPRLESIRFKPNYARDHHLGPVSTVTARNRICVFVELSNVKLKGAKT